MMFLHRETVSPFKIIRIVFEIQVFGEIQTFSTP